MKKFAYLAIVAAIALVSLQTGLRAGELRLFTGQIQSEEAGAAEQAIELVVYVSDGTEDQNLFWIQLADAGRPQLAWLDRFGRLDWNLQGQASGPAPRVLYNPGDGPELIDLHLVSSWPEGAPAAGQSWERDGYRYRIDGTERVDGEECWRIVVATRFGDQRVMLTEKDRPLVLQLEETVFLGPGQQHQLTLKLAERQALSDDDWQQVATEYGKLDELRQRLGGISEKAERRWNDEQLAIVKDELPRLASKVSSGGFAMLMRGALAEAQREQGRAVSLDALKNRALKQNLPQFSLDKVTAESLTREQVGNQVSVFHFWDYRDAPLREPYGQAGYLDFLNRRYGEKGLRVVGVVSNQQSENPQQRRSAVLSAKKFSSFMNLSYPLYVDGGELLAKVGDPRTCNSPLPLFMVVGRDGRILHYSAGFYEVNGNEGLKELEEAIKLALNSGE